MIIEMKHSVDRIGSYLNGTIVRYIFLSLSSRLFSGIISYAESDNSIYKWQSQIYPKTDIDNIFTYIFTFIVKTHLCY